MARISVETVLRACLGIRAAWPEAKLLLGNAQVALGKVAAGIATYEAALADRPGWDQAGAALGRARARLPSGIPPDSGKPDLPRSEAGSPSAGSAPRR